jgi:hypothetical protein
MATAELTRSPAVDEPKVAERHRRVELVAFALLAYVPFLFSSPGRVTADTKQYLYLDPGRLLSRAPYLWDEHVGFGTVSHQIIGYLFPMGPFYWLTQHAAIPDWVAQRFWLGSISLAAALGARWLFRMLGTGRAGAIAGALVYMLTPYQLAFSARISVLLLAWAGLPWLVGLAMRATRRGGWREPALFALVVLTIGSVNASSLLFVGLGPALWLLLEACRGREPLLAVLRATGRMAVLTVGVCLWWIVGLRTQGAYGLPVLQLTETVRTVAADSNPVDILRGIGNWYFYGRDRLGFSIDQASSYRSDVLVQAASFAIPVVALAAAAITRWRHRTYFALLAIVGTVVSVGAWPYDHPSWYGRFFKAFAGDTAAGLALRNTPRAVPLIILGLAGLIAAGVAAVAPRFGALWPTVVIGVLLCAAMIPVGVHGYLSHHLDRPEDVPDYWTRAIHAMQAQGDSTRVLEIPGSDFSAYRWGDTIEPITPGLMDRPYVARETLPSGSAASVNLLAALDQRIQDGTLDPNVLAAYARLTNVGTVALRADLEYERFDTPRPRAIWQLLTDPIPDGLRAPQTFGAPTRNHPPSTWPKDDPVDLAIPKDAADPPPVALFAVEGTLPIVHSAPTDQPVLLSGDGDGIVDAISAGIVDGRALVLQTEALTPKQRRQQLREGADLVLTDSNRRRNQQYFVGVKDNFSYTERAGQDSSPDEYRLDPFTGDTDTDRTVVEQRGGTVDASAATNASARPAMAVDGDPQTAWLVAGDVVGERLTITADAPQTIDHVTLTQRGTGVDQQSIAEVRLTFDGGDPITVALDPAASVSPSGQTVSFPSRTAEQLSIEITGVNQPSTERNPVGFTEVGFGDTRITEIVRLPVDVAERIGNQAAGHRLDVVLSRLRSQLATRTDEERTLQRRFVLPDTRSYFVSGTARVDPNAPDAVIDAAMGTTALGVQYSASSHLAGDLDARASRAFDGDPSSAWTPSLENPYGAFLGVSLPQPETVDRLTMTFAQDAQHFIPAQVTLVADGQPVRTFIVPRDATTTGPGLRTVELHFDPITAQDLRVQFDANVPVNQKKEQPTVLPISIAELEIPGVPVPASPATIDTGCRRDLLTIDGAPFPIEIRGPRADARRGLAVLPCDPSLELTAGSHELSSTAPTNTGFDVDQTTLSSDPAGTASPPTVAGAPARTSGARVHVVSSTPDSYHLRVQSSGKPFWLVLGQSHNDGWEATIDGHSLGAPTLVNGFANGWVVRGHTGTFDVMLRWTPQRAVWLAIGVSVVMVALCVVLVIALRRRRRIEDPSLADSPTARSLRFTSERATSIAVAVAAGVMAGVVVALFSRLWIGLVVGGLAALATRRPRWGLVLAIGAPLALAIGALLDRPELGWLAIALLAGDLVVGAWRGRSEARTPSDLPE